MSRVQFPPPAPAARTSGPLPPPSEPQAPLPRESPLALRSGRRGPAQPAFERQLRNGALRETRRKIQRQPGAVRTAGARSGGLCLRRFCPGSAEIGAIRPRAAARTGLPRLAIPRRKGLTTALSGRQLRQPRVYRAQLALGSPDSQHPARSQPSRSRPVRTDAPESRAVAQAVRINFVHSGGLCASRYCADPTRNGRKRRYQALRGVPPRFLPENPVRTLRSASVGGHIISVGTRGLLSDCFVAEMTGDQLDSGNSCRVATASGRGRERQGGPARPC